MNKELTFKLTCKLYTDEKCFGPGVLQLLQQVDQLHSLHAAAISMEMAYSKAWTIMKNCENALGFKLLSSTTGGKGGGGATLTPEGRAICDAYIEFMNKLNTYGTELFQETFQNIIK